MTIGELKELLDNPMLEDRHEISAAFPDGEDEEYAEALDCAIENHAGGRKLVFRFDMPPRHPRETDDDGGDE